jgi:hypothetical protein
MNSNDKSLISFASGGLHAAMRTSTTMTTAVCKVMLVSTLAPVINQFERYLFFIIPVGVSKRKRERERGNYSQYNKQVQ